MADDLREESRDLGQRVFKFAESLALTAIDQLHIYNQSQEDIQDFEGRILAQTPKDSEAVNKLPETGGLLQCIEESLYKKLENRWLPANRFKSDKVKIKGMLRFSDHVSAEFDQVIDEIKPDIIAFGHHEAIHRRPLTLGKMPFYAMLKHDLPLLLIPDRK